MKFRKPTETFADTIIVYPIDVSSLSERNDIDK